MHLLVSSAIVIFCLTIRSNAVSNETVIDISDDAVRYLPFYLYFHTGEMDSERFMEGHFVMNGVTVNYLAAQADSSLSNMVENKKNLEAVNLVLERARKFSAEYVTNWGNIADSFVVSPMVEFLSLLSRKTVEREIMEILGFAKDDPRMVDVGGQTLIRLLNRYMLSEDLPDDQPSTENPVSELPEAAGPAASSDDTNLTRSYVVSGGQWNVKFDALRTEEGPFYRYNDDSISAKYMVLEMRCLYGKINGTTFIELTSHPYVFEYGISMFLIRSDDDDSYGLLKSQLGKIDHEELRAIAEERVIELHVPKLNVFTDFNVTRWAPDFFPSEKSNLEFRRQFFAVFSENLFENSDEFSIDSLEDSKPSSECECESCEDVESREPLIDEEIITFKVNRPFALIAIKPRPMNLNLFTIAVGGNSENWLH